MKLNRRHPHTVNGARGGEESLSRTHESEATLRPRCVLFARLRDAYSVHPNHDHWYHSYAAPGELYGSAVVHHHGCGSETRHFVEAVDLCRCQDRTVCSSRWKHRPKNHCNLPNPRPYLIKKLSVTTREGRSAPNTKFRILGVGYTSQGHGAFVMAQITALAHRFIES